MTVIQETRVANGSIASAWEAVSKMGAVEEWHPNVEHADVLTDNDSGVGASRRVVFYSGDSVVETVVDDSYQEFTTVEMTESPMLKQAHITISTTERTADTTDVTFSIDYRVQYGPVGWLIDVVMMRRMFRNVFDAALAGLSYHLETGELVADGVPALWAS